MKNRRTIITIICMCLVVAAVPLNLSATAYTPAKRSSLVADIKKAVPEESYAGVYVDDDGELVLNVKTGASAAVIVRNMERQDTKVHYVKYSLSELEEMRDALIPYMKAYNIVSLDANEKMNTVDIELSCENSAIYDLLESISIIDTDIIRVTVIEEDVELLFTVANAPPDNIPEEFVEMYDTGDNRDILPTVVIYPGLRIAIENGSELSYVTAGPRRNSTSFYSAGHAVNSTRPYVYDRYGEYRLGHAGSKIFGANGDRCIITISDAGELPESNQMLGPGRYSISGEAVMGDSVEMWGAFSGVSEGVVLATDRTVTFSDGTTVGNLTKASYTCIRGDSGAGVFSVGAGYDTNAECYGLQSIGAFTGDAEVSDYSYFYAFP